MNPYKYQIQPTSFGDFSVLEENRLGREKRIPIFIGSHCHLHEQESPRRAWICCAQIEVIHDVSVDKDKRINWLYSQEQGFFWQQSGKPCPVFFDKLIFYKSRVYVP